MSQEDQQAWAGIIAKHMAVWEGCTEEQMGKINTLDEETMIKMSKELFAAADKDGDGFLNEAEYKAFTASQGKQMHEHSGFDLNAAMGADLVHETW